MKHLHSYLDANFSGNHTGSFKEFRVDDCRKILRIMNVKTFKMLKFIFHEILI